MKNLSGINRITIILDLNKLIIRVTDQNFE